MPGSVDFSFVSFVFASLAMATLLVIQLRNWRKGISSFVLLVATVITLLWCLSLLIQTDFYPTNLNLVLLLESLKNFAWFTLLLSLLGIRKLFRTGLNDNEETSLSLVSLSALGVPAILLLYLLYQILGAERSISLPTLGGRAVLFGFLLCSIVGLALLEQVFRNIRAQHQWHTKFLCLGLGVLYSFDLLLYSEAILFGRIAVSFWELRGFITGLAALIILVSILRTRQQPLQVNISRRLVFHTGVLVAAGIYLLLMSAAGYYIRSFPGEWGLLLQVLFWAVSLSLLVILILSGRLRSRLKFYISRNLFSTKYDYRDEWMRLSETLANPNIDDPLPLRAIQGLANIVDSSAGALWLTANGVHYDQMAQLEVGWIPDSTFVKSDYLVQQLISGDRVINVKEDQLDVNRLPAWFKKMPRAWLVIPLELHGELLGFVLLKDSRVELTLNWEDYDLLKAAGQQTASYLAQMLASDTLSEVKQFNAFNQISAFVVHDIKTLNSQLSMLVRNAESHKSNPEFIDDMIRTTEHAVSKMDLLLKHFKEDEKPAEEEKRSIKLVGLIESIIHQQSKFSPLPVLLNPESDYQVYAIEHQLKACITHLIQNAQDATPDHGSVEIAIDADGDQAQIEIRDTGSGMSQEFIQTRLFRPFESTKGLTGMGVGAFQSREYIRKLGGDLTVQSAPGEGTTFRITIPLYAQAD